MVGPRLDAELRAFLSPWLFQPDSAASVRGPDSTAQLRRFLKTAQARGLKHVLVITGKGAAQTASRSFYEEDERGVLRNAVPHWLSDPEFASLVVSNSQAPRRLGGEGALYVRLRRPRSG